MKTKSSSSPFALLAILSAFLLVAFFYAVLTLPAHAAEAGAEAVATAVPWYADGAVIGGVIAAVTSLLALWANKAKNTAQKVSESLVIAIETASKIPAVAEKEKAIKQAINAKVTELGVQPLVHRIVKDVTL